VHHDEKPLHAIRLRVRRRGEDERDDGSPVSPQVCPDLGDILDTLGYGVGEWVMNGVKVFGTRL
jgi:hypothetical protein